MLRSSLLRKTLFVAGVLGSLGFGGAQAFATPDPGTDGTFCNDIVCHAGCMAKGHWGGYCVPGEGCTCYRI